VGNEKAIDHLAGGGKERFFFGFFRRSMALPIPWFGISKSLLWLP
jgi:hypothetical protein